MSANDIRNGISFELQSHMQEVLSACRNQRELALNEIGFQVRSHVLTLVPIDTGNLARNFTHRTDDDSVTIGTNVTYGKFVEFNDNAKHTNGQAHFLRDSVQNHLGEYKMIAERRLKT